MPNLHSVTRLSRMTVNAIAATLIETDMVTSNPNASPALMSLGICLDICGNRVG